jgi:hypothetical protein
VYYMDAMWHTKGYGVLLYRRGVYSARGRGACVQRGRGACVQKAAAGELQSHKRIAGATYVRGRAARVD